MNRDILKDKINKLLDAMEEKNAHAMQEQQLRAEILENIPPHGLSVERAKVKRRGRRCRHIRNWEKLEAALMQDHGFTAEVVKSLMNRCCEKVHSDPSLIVKLKPARKAKPQKATKQTNLIH